MVESLNQSCDIATVHLHGTHFILTWRGSAIASANIVEFLPWDAGAIVAGALPLFIIRRGTDAEQGPVTNPGHDLRVVRGHDRIVLWILTTPIQFWAGWQFYRGAWAALRHRTSDMNTLIAVGTSAAYLYSVGLILFPGFFQAQGVVREVYFDTSTIIITLILLGRYLEAIARGRTCTHYLANVIPVLGATGALALVAQCQPEFFWLGLAFNAAGIVYVGRKLWQASGHMAAMDGHP